MAPASSIWTLRPLPELDFHDSRSVSLPKEITAIEAWNLMMGAPGPLIGLAFKTRDAISSLFGVKRIGGFSGKRRAAVQAGDRLDFFLVEHSAPDMLVLTERDRHLDVMICLSAVDQLLTVTASVVTHNAYGRMYMLPVGPAHRLIVSRFLHRLQRGLSDQGSRPIPCD